MAGSETRLLQKTRMLAAVRKVNQLIVREKDPERLLGEACRLLVETRGFSNAWILQMRGEELLEPFYHAGAQDGVAAMSAMLRSGAWPSCVRDALSRGGLQVKSDPPCDCAECPLARTYGGHAGMTVRIEHDGRVHGCMILSCPAAIAGSEEEHDLVKELAGDIGFALSSLETQAELEASRKLLDDVLDAVPDMLWLKDPEGVYLLCNAEFEALVDATKEEIVGGTDYDIFPRAKADSYRKYDLRAIRNAATSVNEESADFSHAGYSTWLETRKTPVYGPGGDLIGVLGLGRDIGRRKQTLKESEEKQSFLNKVVDCSPVPTWIGSPEGTLLRANRALYAALNLSSEQLVGRYNLSLDDNLDRPDIVEKIALVLQEKRQVQFELDWRPGRVRDVDFSGGADVYIDVSAFPLLDPDGEISHVVVQWVDITERWRVEEKLRDHERVLSDILEATLSGYWDRDLVENTEYLSPALKEMFGYRDHELENVPETRQELICPEDRPMVRAAFDEHVRTRGRSPFNLEVRNRHKDGSTVWVICAGRVIEWEKDGSPRRMVGCHVDITAQKQAEEALRSSEELLREAQKIAHIAHWTFDPATGMPWWSEELYRIYGRDPADGPLPYEDHPDLVHPDDWDWFDATVRDTAEHGTPFDIVLRILRPDGSVRFINSICQPVLDGRGAVIQMRGTIQDITKVREAEAEKGRLEGRLRQAQKMEAVGRLAGGVAHDFNNMLGVILGYSDLILDRPDLEPGLREEMTEIKTAGERSAELTRQLLAFARKQTIAPRVIDLNETMTGMVKMLERLIGEDIDLAWLPGDALWPVKIDPGQVDQIMANLCVNARDAITDVGNVSIETGNATLDRSTCERYEGLRPGDYVRLSVRDDGCGMEPETLENVFEPFFTTKEVGKGTGLGLAMVYGVVKQNRGYINIESRPNRGTEIDIYLPRHIEEAAAEPAVEPASHALRGEETVLLVEDEPGILKMVTMMLEGAGYSVLAAGTPGEAIEHAGRGEGEIHLLMTDVVMPGMNGRDLTRTIMELHPGLRSLYMSGYTANVIGHHGVLDDGVHFIQKPFSKLALRAKVREVLDGE